MKTKAFPPAPLGQFSDLDTDGTDHRSHAVKIVDRYVMDGRTFCTFEEAITARENKIEEFVRPLFRTLDPAKAANTIPAMQWVLDNRAALRALLDY